MKQAYKKSGLNYANSHLAKLLVLARVLKTSFIQYKTGFLFFFLFLLQFGCGSKLTVDQSRQLWKNYNEQNYFKLNSCLSKIKFTRNNADLVLFKAKIEHVFNNPTESNELINLLLEKYYKNYNDTILSDLYQMQATNAMRLQDYRNAYIADSIVISKYSKILDSTTLVSLNNDIRIYRILSNQQKMEIIRNKDCTLPLKKDLANLLNIPVILKNDTIDFVFDTGANMSVIDKSHATEYGLKIIGKDIIVGGSTGKYTKAEIGLSDISLGNIHIKNCVFIILPDSDLSFNNGMYKIKGIIGFPIMYALNEFIVKNDSSVIFPLNYDEKIVRNMAFDELYVVAMAVYKNDTLPFHFDSGANTTDLFSSFYKKYKQEITSNCKKETVTIESVGGAVKSEVYILDSAAFTIGNSSYTLKSLNVPTTDMQGNDVKYFYGNLGRDYIKSFSVMKVNFASMQLSFSDKEQ
jgi:predicted aspartyl protease